MSFLVNTKGHVFAELQVNDNRNSIGQELVDNFYKYLLF